MSSAVLKLAAESPAAWDGLFHLIRLLQVCALALVTTKDLGRRSGLQMWARHA